MKDQIECALGSHPDTYIFNSALLSLPDRFWEAHAELAEIQEAVDSFAQSQISVIVTAKTDREFDEAYAHFRSQLKDFGIQRLEDAIDRQFQENCAFYGETIEKVN